MSQNSLDLAPFIWLIFIYNQQNTSKPFLQNCPLYLTKINQSFYTLFSNILPEINNNWQYLNTIWLCIDNTGIRVLYNTHIILYEYCGQYSHTSIAVAKYKWSDPLHLEKQGLYTPINPVFILLQKIFMGHNGPVIIVEWKHSLVFVGFFLFFLFFFIYFVFVVLSYIQIFALGIFHTI
jgi:hypothetical protein